jgi:hypothetical protein
MKSSVTNSFRKQLEQLPKSVQEQADKAYALWQTDPYHNSLQFKRVSQRQPISGQPHTFLNKREYISQQSAKAKQ